MTDKFKFFFKATLLQQVDELLHSIIKQLKVAYALVNELKNLISPIQLELSELQEKIENIKRVEQISKEVQLLKEKLAWSWVYDVDEQLQKQRENIEKMKDYMQMYHCVSVITSFSTVFLHANFEVCSSRYELSKFYRFW